MRKTLLVFLALILVLPAAAQQPSPDAKAAEEARRQRERAIEKCRAHRGTDCTTDAGLAEWLQQDLPRSEAEAAGARTIYQAPPKPTPLPPK
jgi:hypothetical protein